ncbi:phage terminase large subunit family protein [Paenalkalicoccus suaedae]|uniref:Phage terminase large subunit family protein n=2 Tax=Paenalkalicoccus suaedae TaxID=2592382 RepID=A0A859FK67_9BACI|nr:phage terminase large subunit family protein [Paenalkalicoccus suaedae]
MSENSNIQKQTKKLFAKLAKIVAPPPELSVSEWADLYRKLSSEASAEPGQWRTERAPYQKEIMDAINDPKTEEIVVMSSAQVGKTEIILNTVAYHVDYDPAPIMIIQPTVDLANTFSKTRLAPMLRDTPALKNKVADAKSRDSSNTIREKAFPGGVIMMVGANSPTGLSSRPVRILLADEVDRFPVSAGTEGDPLSLAVKRTNTFANRKKIFVSTPTIKGASRIEKAYEESTQEKWNLPCPSCDELQPLSWDQISFESVAMACKSCGSVHKEYEWKRGKGKWVANNPSSKIRGFHLNEMASPWKKWEEIITDFKRANKEGTESLKVWVNTSMGETWEERGESINSDALLEKTEDYSSEVPQSVGVLTCGVDVQDNRLEYEIVGWGLNRESWGIKYGIIMGDPGHEHVWEELDGVLNASYDREDGEKLQIMSTCIDSGGHHTKTVYDYCKKREINRVWAIKGQGGTGISFIKRPTRRQDSGVWLFTIGVDVGKDQVLSRLRATTEQHGYCHFPNDPTKGYDQDYFKGITSEHKVIRSKGGQTKHVWEKKRGHARNEPFDIRNYATAALEILNPDIDKIIESEGVVKPMVRKKKRKRARRT